MCNFYQGHILNVTDRDIHDFIDIYLDPIILIITFILGYLISNAINKNQEKRRLIRVYNYFQLYYKNQLKSIRSQIDLIVEQKDKVTQLFDTRGIGIRIVNQPYFILESIKKEELFSAWIDIMKKDSQVLINILKFIELTRISFNRYLEEHRGFLQRQNEIRERWNTLIAEFHNLKASLTNAPIEVLRQNPDALKLNAIYNQWGKNADADAVSFKKTIENLVTPLLEYFEPIYRTNPSNEMAFVLIAKSQAIDILYKEWRNEIEGYASYLKELSETLEKEYQKYAEQKV